MVRTKGWRGGLGGGPDTGGGGVFSVVFLLCAVVVIITSDSLYGVNLILAVWIVWELESGEKDLIVEVLILSDLLSTNVDVDNNILVSLSVMFVVVDDVVTGISYVKYLVLDLDLVPVVDKVSCKIDVDLSDRDKLVKSSFNCCVLFFVVGLITVMDKVVSLKPAVLVSLETLSRDTDELFSKDPSVLVLVETLSRGTDELFSKDPSVLVLLETLSST